MSILPPIRLMQLLFKLKLKQAFVLFSALNVTQLLVIVSLLTVGKIHAKTEEIEVIQVVNDHEFARANYEVLNRDDFINSSQNLSDVLGQVNGIQIRQISGVGNPVSVSIRGSSAKQVQFYIDGQLVNDSQFGSFDLNQIPTDQIESIEISKNQALGTGSTPIGGVIRINTYNPNESTYKASAALGSFGYQEVSLLKNTAFKHHSLAFGGTYLASDNDYEYTVPQSFDDPSVSVTEPLRNNEFEKFSLFVNDSAQIGQHQLRVNMTYNQQDKGLANYQNNSPENNSSIEMDSLRYGFQYNWLSNISYLETFEVEFYRDEKDEFYLNNPYPEQQVTNDYETIKQHLGINPSFSVKNLIVSPYVNANIQDFTSTGTKNGTPNVCNGISACDITASQNQLNWGGRVDWKSVSLPLYSYVLANQLREKNSNIALNQSNPDEKKSDATYNTQELGVNYGDKTIKTSLSWSNGMRTPTLYELFGDRGSFKGNDDLLPEESTTYNFTIKYDATIANRVLSASTSIYQQTLENSIVAIFNSSGTGSYTNVSNAELSGIEIQAASQLTNDLSLSMQAHIIDSETSSSYVAFNNKKLPGIYHQQYSVAFGYQISSVWDVKLTTSLDKDLYFNRSNLFENNNSQGKTGNPADRFVTDISLQWAVKKYSVNIHCNNLFDEQYQDLANRPAQGRSIQIKLSIKDI